MSDRLREICLFKAQEVAARKARMDDAALARAIAAGDADAAAAASDALLDYIESFTRSTVGPGA